MIEKGVKDNILTRVARAVTQQDVVVYYGGHSYTDGKSIYINYKESGIGKLAALYHELQHVLLTPKMLYEEMHSSDDLRKQVLNVVEDVRIESLAPMYVAALLQYSNIRAVLRIFPTPSTLANDPLKAALACVITHGFLGLNYENLLFVPQYAEKIREAYTVIDSIRGEEDPQMTVKVTDEIVKILNDMLTQTQQNSTNSKNDSTDADEKESSNSISQDSTENQDSKSDKSTITNPINPSTAGSSLIRIKKELRSKQKEIRKNIVKQNKRQFNFSQIKETDNKVIRTLLNNANNRYYKKEITLSNRLAEETYNKIKSLSTVKDEIAYSGKFDQRLWVKNRAVSPVWFKRRSESKELLRRKVALLIDASGSMNGNNKVYAFIAARVFWIVMNKLHIPFSVLYYDDVAYPVGQIDHLTPLSSGGTTPRRAVKEVSKDDKIIVISDGVFDNRDILPDGWNKQALSFRLWGVGIGRSSVFPNAFLKQRVWTVKKPRELPQVVAETLMSILLK